MILALRFFCANFLRFRRGRLCAARFELLNASRGVEQFLFACVEGVAVRADFNFQIGLRGADLERIAAGTDDVRRREISRMNIFFHNVL